MLSHSKVRLKRNWTELGEHSRRALDRLPVGYVEKLVWRIVTDPIAIKLARFHGSHSPDLTLCCLQLCDQPTPITSMVRETVRQTTDYHGHDLEDGRRTTSDADQELREYYGWPLTAASLAKNRHPYTHQWVFREMARSMLDRHTAPTARVFHYFSPEIFEPLFTPKFRLVSESHPSSATTVAIYTRNHALANR